VTNVGVWHRLQPAVLKRVWPVDSFELNATQVAVELPYTPAPAEEHWDAAAFNSMKMESSSALEDALTTVPVAKISSSG